MREIEILSLYRHFKGKWYLVYDEVENTETGAITVAYTALYDNAKSYNRDKEMFLSLTDMKKYPDLKQEYRFMSINELILKHGELYVHNLLKKEVSSEFKNIKYDIYDFKKLIYKLK